MLDPRYKKHVFESPRAVSAAVRYISGRVAEKMAEAGQVVESQQEPQTIPPETASRTSLWAAVDAAVLRHSSETGDPAASDCHMPPQLLAYYRNPVVCRRKHPNPLATWAGMRVGFEFVYSLAMEYLCIPATSVASERLFSHAGCVATQRRCRLTPTHLGQLTFCGLLIKIRGSR
ncbi:E3 SUMO-protein ligase ZBED1 [Frankliniella fusca]|uniref:E3 SUMO-protein ligase ZBED1 n=1 Tax=Frankliniella fusca TaxID=407009 RepID=A0AAE1H0R8_9NEOP|nr:E3 SUMO-protein ligase ZBED1 [Frankliniella fusca]